MSTYRVTVTLNPFSGYLDLLTDEIDALGLNLERELKSRSPVDTGYFRSNWHYDKASQCVQNNTEYAEALIYGHSSQSPAGWLEAGIDVVTRL